MYVADLKHPNASLEDKLKYIFSLNKGASLDLGFRPVYLELLEKLGNPHLNLPPTIHIAGTNGKGSTLAFLKSILTTAGYRCHAYTSPHLMKMNERIVLAGEEISDDYLEQLIDETLALNEDREISFFELTTAMAFKAFSETPGDFILLETGLGGRLDCTNVVPSPALTIITHIGLDHTEFLGDTLAKIAAEKAGILKQNVPCIITPQSQEAIDGGVLNVLKTHSEEIGAPLIVCDDVNTIEPNDIGITGVHQLENALLAKMAAQELSQNYKLSEETIRQGLKTAEWRARLQNITHAIDSSKKWEIFLDGGHNESAAKTLAVQFQQWNAEGHPVHFVVGMMRHKDPQNFLEPLLPIIDSLTLVPIPGEPHALSTDELKQVLLNSALKLNQFMESDDALTGVRHIMENGDGGKIVIGGSLYLAGHVLSSLAKSAQQSP